MTSSTNDSFVKYHFAKNEGSKRLVRDLVFTDVKKCFDEEPGLARVICIDCLESESQEILEDAMDAIFYSDITNRNELTKEEGQQVMEIKQKVLKTGTLNLSDEDLQFIFTDIKAIEIILIAMAERRLSKNDSEKLNEWIKGIRDISNQLANDTISELD